MTRAPSTCFHTVTLGLALLALPASLGARTHQPADDLSVDLAQPSLRVELGRQVRADQGPLIFESPATGVAVAHVIELVNAGTQPLVLRAIDVQGVGFEAAPLDSLPLDLPPAASASVLSSFTPSAPGTAHGSLRLFLDETDAPTARPVIVDFVGRRSAPVPQPSEWTSAPPLPLPVGEVASALISNVLYVVGDMSQRTLAYDIAAGAWDDTLAHRPYVGHHHAAEVYDQKLYLIGGLDGGAAGRVQIYDPVGDSWSLGAPMPWAAGAASTALIDDKIYVAGGIVASTTVDNCGAYDPRADSWTMLASTPSEKGRNHAAGATDGERFFIFGGRGVGSGVCNCVANGFDSVHIYDPDTDTWDSTELPGSTLARLPQGRGGMGRAVHLDGEFFVFGGETKDGPGANQDGVYNRVDVYDPVSNTWRPELSMPTARHGIYPVARGLDIYIAAGGTDSGFSGSTAFEIFTPSD